MCSICSSLFMTHLSVVCYVIIVRKIARGPPRNSHCASRTFHVMHLLILPGAWSSRSSSLARLRARLVEHLECTCRPGVSPNLVEVQDQERVARLQHFGKLLAG